MSVVGNCLKDTTTTKIGGVIEEAGCGVGAKEMVARNDLKKFVKDGCLTVRAEIRVRRSPIANVNLQTA